MAAGIGLFIIIGLAAAYMVGFQPDFGGNLPIDEEQNGLQDRIVIKFSHVVAENTPKGLAAAHFASLVKAKSNDRVEIQVFPNGMKFTEENEFAALERGDIQMIAPSFSNLNAIDPDWLIMDLPFAFENQEEVDQALQGPLGEHLFATLEPHGMHGAAFWANGFRQMTNSVHQLRGPEDFQGLNFRIQPSPVIERQFELLGAKTRSLPFNEVYRNLEAGKVDGQENPVSNIMSKKLYQVQRYMTISNHSYLGYAVIFNRSFWESLPTSVQQLLTEALEETTRWNGKEALAYENKLRTLAASGEIEMTTLTQPQREQWRERMKPLYAEFSQVISPDLMEAIHRP